MKIFSWNVNGIRAVFKKGEWEKFIKNYSPDAICIQETKASGAQLSELDLEGYKLFSSSAKKAGYSGTAILVKKEFENEVIGEVLVEPKNKELTDTYGDLEEEGRITALEFKDFFLISVYTPNSKNDLSRLEIRKKWDDYFLDFVKKLQKIKPVIFAGDLNVAAKNIDLARPKENEGKHGFTLEERAGFANFISSGFKDSFREKNPDEIKYSWWTAWGGARAKNVGWRIDYFLTSGINAKSANIHNEQFGSDHCPISIEI